MKQANLGLIFFPAFDWMISPGHPERQERLLYTRDQLTEEGLFDRPEIREYRLRMAEINDLQRAHVGVPSIAKLITPAHLASAGGCMTAADAVMSGEVKRAFALVRPPGHHAMRIVHGIRGFCTINIEAVMVEYLRSRYGIKKIAVVDTDVHHGDGSQDIFTTTPTCFIFRSIRTGARCTRARAFRMKQAARRRGAITSTCRFYPAAAIRKYTACLTG